MCSKNNSVFPWHGSSDLHSIMHLYLPFELCHEKINNVVSDTNQAVQPQKIVRGCKIWI